MSKRRLNELMAGERFMVDPIDVAKYFMGEVEAGNWSTLHRLFAEDGATEICHYPLLVGPADLEQHFASMRQAPIERVQTRGITRTNDPDLISITSIWVMRDRITGIAAPTTAHQMVRVEGEKLSRVDTVFQQGFLQALMSNQG